MPLTEDYVDEARKVIDDLIKIDGKYIVTTSKIRNLLAMTADIYNEVRTLRDAELGSDTKERIAYLRMRCVYEAGRDKNVRSFVDRSKILDKIRNIKTKQDYEKFSHYMEALVAWRKYLCDFDA